MDVKGREQGFSRFANRCNSGLLRLIAPHNSNLKTHSSRRLMVVFSSIVLLLIFVHDLAAQSKKFYFKQNTFVDSQALPLAFAYKKWDVAYQPGGLTQGFVRTETGYTDGKQSMGIIYRFDVLAKYTSETIEFLHQVKNKTPLPLNKEYDISLDIKHFRAGGVKFDYAFQLSQKISLVPSLSILRAHYLTEGILQGNATAISEQDYDFDLNVDYYYTRDTLFNRRATPPTGWGFAFDLAFHATPIQNLDIRLNIYDLLAYLYWRATPRTVAQADSSTKNYDLNGYLNFEPVLTGKESSESYTQRLTPRAILQAEYRIGRIKFNPQMMATAYKNYYFLDTGFNISHKHWFIVGTEISTKTIKLGYKTNDFGIEILSNSIQPKNIYTLFVNFSFLTSF